MRSTAALLFVVVAGPAAAAAWASDHLFGRAFTVWAVVVTAGMVLLCGLASGRDALRRPRVEPPPEDCPGGADCPHRLPIEGRADDATSRFDPGPGGLT